MTSLTHHNSHFVNGSWVPAGSSERIEVFNPATAEVLGSVPAGTAADVDAAVQAAHAAFAGWSETPVAERAEYLAAISRGMQARVDELADLITRDLGCPHPIAIAGQAGRAHLPFDLAVDLLRNFDFESTLGTATLVREPIGVVGAITPWNFPLMQISGKVAPALAAGCTVVLKPTEIAPLVSYVFAEIVAEAGLPAGVFNLVQGYGEVVGEAIVAHPLVDMISFTGSTNVGKRVSAVGGQTVKRVALELGGKSANILLDDVDFEEAVANGVGACFGNTGQVCAALTRMLVPRSRLAEVEEIAVRVAETYVVGDPFDAGTVLGPLVSETQLDRVRRYIELGIKEGAKLLTGGPDPVEGHENGYFVRPTVFSDVEPGMTIEREEIFGPVLSIIGYDDEDDAVRIANDSIYGLSGGVSSADRERAVAVAKRIRTGQVRINGSSGFDPLAPFGGYKQSGLGREWGVFGFEEFLEVKAVL